MGALQAFLPPLLKGLWVTLQLTVAGGALAVLLSLLGGLGRLSRWFPIRTLATCYVEVFRGTSALVQLYWFYYVLPLFGLRLEAMAVGGLVLGLNIGAYGSEVVRGAILAVPRGQHEAALALNFSHFQILWRIIIPQAAIAMLPPMGNLMIELLKSTSLVSLITISDLTFVGQTLRADTLRTAEIFILVLLLYFAAASCITFLVRALERRLAVGRDIGGLK